MAKKQLKLRVATAQPNEKEIIITADKEIPIDDPKFYKNNRKKAQVSKCKGKGAKAQEGK